MTTSPPDADDIAADDLERRMRGVAAAHLDVAPERLLPAARLGEDLCIDSLDAVELTLVLEDEFDVSLPEAAVGEVRTYGELVALVRAQSGGVGPQPPPVA